ncbi:MAG: hypothetical protein LAN64_17015 [Acidobacteriia bacterium]|nr:hypothetical protein [Terriglobia bacterium]
MAQVSSSHVGGNIITSTYAYDRFGNRWQQNSPGGPSPQYAFDAYNRIVGSGFTYDIAGNVASFNDGAGHIYNYSYDAENRLISVSGAASASYVYDAAGHRVRKTNSGTSVDFVYDLAGRAVVEVRASDGVPNRIEIYAGPQHIATYNNSTTYFNYSDSLLSG